jgi:hypothetical protein
MEEGGNKKLNLFVWLLRHVETTSCGVVSAASLRLTTALPNRFSLLARAKHSRFVARTVRFALFDFAVP